MSTIINNAFAINGVVSTDRTVIQNINTLCSASSAWMTYDISEGLWSVVINQPGSAVASFNDANIIGGINVSGTGVNELYNAATIEFPHKDIRDQTDYIDLSIPTDERFPNELDNRLNMSFDCINNPIQAQYIASVELKQGRLDKVIEFRSDYNTVGLKAGDLISVTNSVYGYTNKLFRIVKLMEEDDDFFTVSITAIEYDADVYDSSDLVYTKREKKTGIVPKAANTALTTSDNNANATSSADGFNNLLTPAAIATLLALGAGPLFEYLKTTSDTAKAGTTAQYPGTTIPTYASTYSVVPASTVLGQFNAYSGSITTASTDWEGDPSAYVEVFFNLPTDFTTIQFFVDNPFARFVIFDQTVGYSLLSDAPLISGVTKTQFPELSEPVVTDITVSYVDLVTDVYTELYPIDVEAYIPMSVVLYYEGQPLSLKITSLDSSTSVFTVSNPPAGEFALRFIPVRAMGTFSGRVLHSYYNPAPGLEILSNLVVRIVAFKN